MQQLTRGALGHCSEASGLAAREVGWCAVCSQPRGGNNQIEHPEKKHDPLLV